MADKGHIKRGHKLSSISLNNTDPTHVVQDLEYPFYTLHGSQLTIGGKVVSYQMLENMILRRFHICMRHESKNTEIDHT